MQLTSEPKDTMCVDMTKKTAEARNRRRGRAIALGKANTETKTMIVKKFGSVTAFGARCGYSQSHTSGILRGIYACPAEMDRAFRKAFPKIDPKWPKGLLK